MVAAFIRQRTGGTENFYNGNGTKKEEDNPDYFVAFEYVFD
jgi:hypothetical protein